MLRRKTWQYLAIASEEAFVSAAIVHLGYAGLAFATAYDRRTGTEASFERLVPFARGFRVARGLSEGESTYRAGRERLRMANQPRRLEIDLPEFKVTADLGPGTPWQAAWPIGSQGRNETLKDMGVESRGTLSLRGRALSLDGHAMVDWTCGTPARQTEWRWAAGVAKAGERHVAWNLRTGFDDPLQVENALWVDGQPVAIGPAEIRPGEPWRITAEGLELTFEPEGMRRDDRNLILLATRYQQPWGRYRGEYAGQPLVGYGVVEDHWSVW